ncbi:S41 family peptidase [Sphingomonas xanthus]|uniref:S41 family peptidase n=1 Tax=Sphingomonas xanthus TaxID=2594473 RepID=UPI00164E95B3|nr:S41 family peptidase [Sphingomonas xanthus]
MSQTSPQAAASTEAPDPFVAAEAHRTVEKLATTLEQDFVLPKAAKAYADMLRNNLAAGSYARFPDAKSFAAKVTEDIQAVHSDRHLRLHVIPLAQRGGSDGDQDYRPLTESGQAKSGWIAPGIAYVAFTMFPGNEASLSDLRKFLDEHGDADTLIIDARQHRGGGLAEIDMIFGEIFDQPTDLVLMDTRRAVEEREGSPFEDLGTLHLIPTSDDVVRRMHRAQPDSSPTRLRQAKVYYLTSKRTASAAEHLALALKRSGRATIVGENTRGAGNYGTMRPMGSIFAAFVPVGRTYDPDTNKGWEGTGIAPDVAVEAPKALDEALRLAGRPISGEEALAALR